ncbi:hypothetical protein HG536_0A04970 [Torulaspora globosa]|uniref:Thiamine pyrophosphokinase n=1 Tax=Torulaspora globosa TaxID=48254 RepID=A0A7G3ZAZ6_9SACH|nr:uncharacterized protein HG536_0A04970 [Torulaspora globosa]QLL30682.1 hypothetical protein HG536_0A04970 [Torulaspora globosa]
MSEWCKENEERIPVAIDPSKYSHRLDLKGCIKPASRTRSVLLILNQKINIPSVFLKLWGLFKLKVCADGGANRLYDFFDGNEPARAYYLPDYIIGDFDSLKPEVEQYYRNAGVILIKQRSQFSTDFTKALHLISIHFNDASFVSQISQSKQENHSIEINSGIHDWYYRILGSSGHRESEKISLLAIGAIDGRFDQTMHSITQLYKLSSSASQFRLSYLSATDLIFFVPSGGVLLEYTADFREKCIGNCGLLPLNGPTEIYETAGLKWDVGLWETSVASGKLSSSNRFAGIDKCYINVKDGIVMNVEVYIDRLAEYI